MAITHCDNALTRTDDSASKQKVALRKARCCFYLKRYEDAIAALSGVPRYAEATELERCIRRQMKIDAGVPDKAAAQTNIVLKLPSCKPAMYEYQTLASVTQSLIYLFRITDATFQSTTL